MLARYIFCHRVSVCLSVSSRSSTKRLNLGSHKQRRTIAKGLKFSDAKNLGEIPTGSSPTGRQIEVGKVKIGDFRPISRHISETVQDRDIVTMAG